MNTSKLSKVVLIFGILAFIFAPIFALPAIICGHVSLSTQKKMNTSKIDIYFRWIGLILAYIGILVFSIVILMILPFFKG